MGKIVDRTFWMAAMAGAVAATCHCCDAMAEDRDGAAMPVCGGAAITEGIVSHVGDGHTFAMADGREVRLAAIAVPPLAPPDFRGKPSPWGAAAKTALEALAGGDRVALHATQAEPDRYGRIVAYAYAERDGDQADEHLFVQGELIASGLARVADRVDSQACAAALLGRENAARKARLGLWADPYYDLVDAEAPAEVLARKGQFTLVEGKVVSVRESGPTIYLNFGRRWSEDFSVTVWKRNERIFVNGGLDLKGLEGRRVIVRGFVEARGSRGMPSIEAEHPVQIEAADRD